MRYPGDLLYRFMKSLPIPASAPAEAEIEIPDGLLGVITIPGPIKFGGTFSTTETQRESFNFFLTVTRPASQAQVATQVLAWSRGLWLLVLTLQHHADFTSAPGAIGVQTVLNSKGSDDVFLRLPNIANVSQVASMRTPILLSDDDFAIRMIQGATGAAQTMHSSCDGFAMRLA